MQYGCIRKIKRTQNKQNRLFTLKKQHEMASKAFSSAIAEAKHEIEFINFELGRMGREEGKKNKRKAALLKILDVIDMYNNDDYERIISLGKAGEECKLENAKALQIEAELNGTKKVIDDLIGTMLTSAERFGDVDLHQKVIDVIGQKEMIKRKLKMDLPLWDSDNKFILENL